MRTIILASCVLALTVVHADAQCLGDFNGDGKVTIDELITAVNNSLSNCQLSGPRFVDNGDGTVTDKKTGLMWEKKTAMVVGSFVDCSTTMCSDPHDVGNAYKWTASGTAPDGVLFTDFLAKLNNGASTDGTAITGCFAGHCDWRLPTVSELQTIVDPIQGLCGGGSGRCINPTFGPTQSGLYWSATTLAGNPSLAWLVDFNDGSLSVDGETFRFYARAVRNAP